MTEVWACLKKFLMNGLLLTIPARILIVAVYLAKSGRKLFSVLSFWRCLACDKFRFGESSDRRTRQVTGGNPVQVLFGRRAAEHANLRLRSGRRTGSFLSTPSPSPERDSLDTSGAEKMDVQARRSSSKEHPQINPKDAAWKQEEAQTESYQKQGGKQHGEKKPPMESTPKQHKTTSSNGPGLAKSGKPDQAASQSKKDQQQKLLKEGASPSTAMTQPQGLEPTPMDENMTSGKPHPALPPQMEQAKGTPSSSAEAPLPGDVSGIKELEANRGKPPLQKVIDFIIQEGREFVERIRSMQDSPMAPQQIAKHPPDQNPPPMKRLSTMAITAEEGADFLRRMHFTTSVQQRKSNIHEHDDLKKSKYVPKDVYRQEEELMKKDPEVGPLIVEVEGEESDNQMDADFEPDIVPLDPGEQPEEEFIDNPDDVDDEALAREVLAPKKMSLEERGAKGQAVKQMRDRERKARGISDEYTADGRKKMTPQERGHLGQMAKQKRDRERMLMRGQITEDEPTYQTQRKPQRRPEDKMPASTPQEMGRKGQAVKQRHDRERMLEVGEIKDEGEEIYHIGYGENPAPGGKRPRQQDHVRQGEGRQLTAQELGKRGQAAKQRADRERALQTGEISEDEPVYRTQGRGKREDEEDKPQNPRDMGRKGQMRKKQLAEQEIRDIEREVEEEYDEDEDMPEERVRAEEELDESKIYASRGRSQPQGRSKGAMGFGGGQGGGQGGGVMSPQERGRKGQAAKQRRDRERMLERGEISEEEPTYYSQGRGKQGGGQQRGGRRQQYEEEDEDEEEEQPKRRQQGRGRRYEEEEEEDEGEHKMTPQERGKKGQAMKQKRDRERMLAKGEIDEDEPTYYSQGRGKGGQQQQGRKRRSYRQEEEDEDEDEEEEDYEKKPGRLMTAEEMGRKGQAMKRKHDRERMLARGEISEDEPTYETERRGKVSKTRAPEVYDEELGKPRKKMTAQEMGRRGQAAKQAADRRRLIERGEISDDEPTYYSQGRPRSSGGGGGRFSRKRRTTDEDIEEAIGPKPKHKLTPQESGQRGQAMKRIRDRQRMLEQGEIGEDEPTYYSEGRGKRGGGRQFGGRYEEEEEESEDDEEEQPRGKGKQVTLSTKGGKTPLHELMEKAERLQSEGFTIRINVDRDESGGGRGRQ